MNQGNFIQNLFPDEDSFYIVANLIISVWSTIAISHLVFVMGRSQENFLHLMEYPWRTRPIDFYRMLLSTCSVNGVLCLSIALLFAKQYFTSVYLVHQRIRRHLIRRFEAVLMSPQLMQFVKILE